jgi:uncharacterized phage-associated protein
MAMKNPMFDERRAAQAAVFFLFKAGGRLHVLKLMKLLYLAERLSLQRYGDPLTGDCLVSMPNGPVLSMTYELINGGSTTPDGWSTWVLAREDHMVALSDPGMIRVPEDDLTRLSMADIEVLQETWNDFGHMDQWQLVDYTHNNIPEWKDPKGSSFPIRYSNLFRAVGYSPEQAKKMEDELKAQQYISAAFA